MLVAFIQQFLIAYFKKTKLGWEVKLYKKKKIEKLSSVI